MINDNSLKIKGDRLISCAGYYPCEIIIPAGVRVIGESAFAGKNQMLWCKIPDGVRRIERRAFAGAGMICLRVPDSVEYIGSSAFAGCERLKTLTIPENVEISRYGRIFSDCPNLCTLIIGAAEYILDPSAPPAASATPKTGKKTGIYRLGVACDGLYAEIKCGATYAAFLSRRRSFLTRGYPD